MKKTILTIACCLLSMGMLQAQTAREEIAQIPERSGGNYLNYELVPLKSLTKTPKGYEPFYISHYGRHGSRWLLGDNEYKGIIDQLEKAKTDGVLTATGEEMLSRLKAFYPCTKNRLGELTSVGERQHHNIGKRMTENFPKVFSGKADVNALREKIAQIRERLHADIIVLVTTDNDYYGHSEDDNMRFCDDFYDYGGFGYGEDREGAILFINMDPGQRNFAISVCGSLSYAITDINSREGSDSDIERLMNQMMDPFRQGRYSEAANIYVDTMEKYIYRAYITGQAGREEDRVFDGIRYQDIKPDPDASRVVDKADILSSSAEKKLNKSIDEIREKYGIDVLVLTGDETPNDLTVQDYLPAYFRYHGYGEGSDKRGLGILIIRNGKNYNTYLTNCGDTPSLSEAMIQRISSLMPKSIKTDRQAESAANVFVKKTRFFAKWKHIPMSAPACAGLLIGLYIILSIFGKIKKSSGKTVTKAVSAGQYIVPGSCTIRSISENHIDTRVTKTKRPEPSSSSSSYSGGRSGGHSGGGHFSSSGSHHSGGSRHF